MLKHASEFLSSQKDSVEREVETFLKFFGSDLNELGFIDTHYQLQHIKPGAALLFEKKLTEMLKMSGWKLCLFSLPKHNDQGSQLGVKITIMPSKDDWFFG
ncbi:hypothetical protein [Vibrio vulnificus]|uniref:hypothetical protein n=1 Tax=Vibrio vulnificus TaxID=672 RepID=UPI001CDBBC8B|nr:hypothetical protein [Vibrio vulnificus]MCA4019684.1 hypothetical protein [Vibrio vulnificus]